MEKISNLKKKCQLLEKDIAEIISEIIELGISREQIIDELKKVRKELYMEIGKIEKTNKFQTL